MSSSSVSLEALAMAGVDCREVDISFEEWEAEGFEHTPPHLLPDHEDEVIRSETTSTAFTSPPISCACTSCQHTECDHESGFGGNCKENNDDFVCVKGKLNMGFLGIVEKSLIRCLNSVKILVRAILRLL